MSDKIPFEIQMEIVQRTSDIKSVIQYRSVSKAWKSVIDSKEFVTGHTCRHIQQQPRRLLIRGQDFDNPPKEVKYVSIVDDETFPHQKFTLSVPDSVKTLSDSARILGSSHGLFCLFDCERKMVVIWNPSIRKTVVVPYEVHSWNAVVFGVCPNTLDPKIVKIPYDCQDSIEVEVFTLSLGSWRSPLSNTCPRKLGYPQAVVDGFIYWDGSCTLNVDGVYTYHHSIMSFDLTSEEFTELYIPTSCDGYLHLSNLRESLGVFEFICSNYVYINVWMMKGCGCTRSFEKLYHISPPDASIYKTLGFRRSGAPIFEIDNNQNGHYPVAVAAYEPESKDIIEIWSNGIGNTFDVHSYMETLLLLDH